MPPLGEFWAGVLVYSLFAVSAVMYFIVGLRQGGALSGVITVIQIAIVIGVVLSDIHYRWSNNPYIPALLGIGLAYAVTVWPFKIWHRRTQPEYYARRKQEALEDYHRYCAERGITPRF